VTVPVLVAAAGAAWEAPLVTALGDGDQPARVARRCVDAVDLLGAATAGLGRACLLDAALPRLDADVVDRLHAVGVACVGVTERGDEATEQRLRAMGIDYLVPADSAPAVIATALADAAATAGQSMPTHGFAGSGLAGTGPVDRRPWSGAADGAVTAVPVSGQPARPSTVVAVWGPTGAPGRSTVALALADEIARLGPTVLLVDADCYGGVQANLLGVLDESPGLAAACRLAGSTRLDAAALAGLCWQVRPGLRLLSGIALATRWPELRVSALPVVFGAARSLAEWVIVDVGFCLEADEEISFDSLAPRRNGATLAVLDIADRVVAVGGCDPVGLVRLVRGLSELREVEVVAPVDVVLNKAGRAALGSDPAAEASVALQRFAGRLPAAVLPLDLGAVDAALGLGRTLGEVAPASPLRRAFAGYARELSGITSRAQRRRG
jgi:Flp pilus assembly CpaE family ATPase